MHAIDAFLVPAFGSLQLEQRAPQLIQRCLLRHKAEHGARHPDFARALALRSALPEAQRRQRVSLNAATLVKVPKPPKKAIRPLDLEQSNAFLNKADEHPLGALFSVARPRVAAGESDWPEVGRREPSDASKLGLGGSRLASSSPHIERAEEGFELRSQSSPERKFVSPNARCW